MLAVPVVNINVLLPPQITFQADVKYDDLVNFIANRAIICLVNRSFSKPLSRCSRLREANLT